MSGVQGTRDGSLTNTSVSEDKTKVHGGTNKLCRRILVDTLRFRYIPVLIGASLVVALLAVVVVVEKLANREPCYVSNAASMVEAGGC